MSDSWTDIFSVEEYRVDAEDASSVWGRIAWGDMVRDNVRGLIALVAGIYVAAVQAVPRAIADLLDSLRSFAVEVIEVTVAFPQLLLEGSFDAAVAEVATHGAASFTSAILLFILGFGAYNLGVRILVR